MVDKDSVKKVRALIGFCSKATVVSLPTSHHSERVNQQSSKRRACTISQRDEWGNAVLILDQDRFQQGYQNGLRYYFEDRSPEEHPSGQITTSDLLHLLAIPDEQGRYQLEDGRGIIAFQDGVEELVGVWIEYLRGPLYPGMPGGHRKLQAECIVFHEAVPVR
jgi:hypothetical protein